MYRFNAIPIKMPTAFFAEVENAVLKFRWNCKWPQTATQKKKEKGGELTRPNFKTHYEVIAIKRVWYWNKNGNADHNKNIE